MTIHPACRRQFGDFTNAILVRAEMDESAFKVIEATGRDWNYVRKAIDPAMSKQNVVVQGILRELLNCECEIYKEERRR